MLTKVYYTLNRATSEARGESPRTSAYNARPPTTTNNHHNERSSTRFSPEAGMIRSIVVLPTDQQTDEAIAACRVLLPQWHWQPSFELEWRRRRNNRRIVCGQIPRPLFPLPLFGGGGQQRGRREHSRSSTRNRLLFSSTTGNERKRGNPSKQVAAAAFHGASLSHPPPSLLLLVRHH